MLRRNSDDYVAQLPVPVEDPGTPTAAPQHHVADLRELGRILRRRWQTVLAVPLVLVILAGIFVVVVTPLYTATSTVFIDPRRASVADTNNQAAPTSSSPTTPPSRARSC